ncbi:helix-turn-helix domain-containing protein [Amycolatopsis vancoresmycina]|uniref:Putative transcriptional regulator n=1 Tax=Amycolatopsis vancoresmycina DSM 44592 TaxID=1292037 RepID=R1I0C4_9PSEU|nr:helix-turn-helix transcriptional regulator [Amycolatopsis vancoresmycina]EOD69275.1 putative transcriptional regulator [Amycolatopsis vancoresmycina DSM 44592]
MAKNKRVSVRQRRVSAELRTLRVAAGLTCLDVATALDCSESKISRMETGDRGLYADDVSAILGLLRVPAAKRTELLALVREGEERNWHEIHGKLPPNWKELMRFESEATSIQNYEPLLIPGLAQVPDYSRTIIQGASPKLSEAEVDTLVATRMTRQIIFSRRPAPRIHLILDETVLTRPVCKAEVMRAQLRHLLGLAERTNVAIQIVPFRAGPHPGLDGPFVILDFDENPPVSYMASCGTSSFLEEPQHLERVRLAWQGIRAVALSPEESLRLVASALGELTGQEEVP